MGIQDFFTWRPQTSATSPSLADEDLVADVDEPPDHSTRRDQAQAEFQKSLIRPQGARKESLLTKAFHAPEHETEIHKSDIHITTDLTRRRSMMSNASIASTAELTSDGGLTSPARTNTPSPPLPNTTFTHYSLAAKAAPMPAATKTIGHTPLSEVMGVSPKAQPVVQPVVQAPKKRCITFMCDGKREAAAKAAKEAAAPVVEKPATPPPAAPRKCMIKFACPGPKPSAKPAKDDAPKSTLQKSSDATKRNPSRSPSLPRKSPRQPPRSIPKDSNSAVRRASQSPVATRVKPRYIIADEKTINSSEATRFHEFASEEIQEDDWILRDAEIVRAKLTINDTLKKENAIRQLGNEAEAEALDEEEEDEDEETQDGNDTDDENDEEEEDEDEDEDRNSIDYSGDAASDGNESDNEAGFAESDESDAEGEFSFWTPGKRLPGRESIEALIYRPSAHRTASTSSIDSLDHMEPEAGPKKLRRRPIKIRPGTPDLPDSTDFVCGTLDEDRPLEDAYVSCMEARKHARHKQTPQDIDPSFPTSDPEDEEDEDDAIGTGHDSDEPVWLHGKFEESDDERFGRRRSTTMRRKSPAPSPRRLHSPPPPRRHHSPPPKQRLHSPPPPKQRLRSPPPRKLFGHSPKRIHSPPPAQTVRSPAASPTSAKAIAFAPLGSRPGLTHTKSLPRTPNAFCRAYHASRLIAANGNATEGNENIDGHVRGAIDIVKGLEEKRQRRKEKYQKQCNRKSKGHSDRRPQPGKGAERMRELGLLMAGKTGQNDPYMLSA
ncbi:hypothetical protein ONS95_014688 [Cadophora gregata]|uniref:uncharacterized protein n=1 Tax=Cadophora gregata TaxID=51156 RepID=UPI0026DBF2B0|nr:uncharacterized protein ONS95_014688 [Cadophora gregata]KAK0112974.1 hypothetical protein ONS95_014688 [Cadophora gregata]KAK0125097.1 hypothetical protein ONS96_008963 [Cadophora gregata f. sp. sojae]